MDPKSAIEQLSVARGTPIPETPERRRWIERYADSFALT
jgi:hypothetical protein